MVVDVINQPERQRRLKYKPRASDLETILFIFGDEGQETTFKMTFRQPSLGEVKSLAKYASLIGADNLAAENFPPEAIDEFIDLYVSLFQVTQEDTSNDFREFLEELPLDLFEELSTLISNQVFEKSQKKLPPTLEKLSTP